MIHFIKIDENIGRRKGLILERDNNSTYVINLLLSVTGKNMREVSYNFDRNKMFDYPYYWIIFTWRLPGWYRRIGVKKIFESFDYTSGVTAVSLL